MFQQFKMEANLQCIAECKLLQKLCTGLHNGPRACKEPRIQSEHQNMHFVLLYNAQPSSSKGVKKHVELQSKANNIFKMPAINAAYI